VTTTLFAVMAQESGGQIQEIARTFGVDWPHLIAQLISFGIVCALLYWLAYGPVLKMLEERRRLIAQGLENTAKINAALAGIEAQRQGVLNEAQAQSTKLIAEARDIATRLREQEAQRATAAAQLILLQAKDAANQEHARMLADLRREVGRLVVQTTAAVIGKVLTPDDQRRLAEDAARSLRPS
jgi:F-type H+-transporting ATPase subunit b